MKKTGENFVFIFWYFYFVRKLLFWKNEGTYYLCVCVCVCVCVRACACVRVVVYVCVGLCMCLCIYVRMLCMYSDVIYAWRCQYADRNGHTVWGVGGLRPLACWDCGFEFRREHGYLSVVSVCVCVCGQVEVSASDWSLIQRSPTEWGVSECNREALKEETMTLKRAEAPQEK